VRIPLLGPSSKIMNPSFERSEERFIRHFVSKGLFGTDSIIYSLVIYFFVQLEQVCRQQSPVLRPPTRSCKTQCAEEHRRTQGREVHPGVFWDRLHYLQLRNIVLRSIRTDLPSTVLHYLRRVGRAEEPNLRLLGPACRKIEIPYTGP